MSFNGLFPIVLNLQQWTIQGRLLLADRIIPAVDESRKTSRF